MSPNYSQLFQKSLDQCRKSDTCLTPHGVFWLGWLGSVNKRERAIYMYVYMHMTHSLSVHKRIICVYIYHVLQIIYALREMTVQRPGMDMYINVRISLHLHM